MRTIASLLTILATMLLPFAEASPIEDLASLNQEVRDKAAAELRQSFKSTTEDKWLPTVAKITKGQSRTEILRLLEPLNVTKEMGAGSGQSHSESFRLDDEWILICYFHNDGDILNVLQRNQNTAKTNPRVNMPYPLDTFVEAATSVWGRALSFAAVICVAGFFSFGLSLESVGYIPAVMVASVWAGWGIILYPILLIGFALYITREVSPLWLTAVFILCYIDFYAVLNRLQDLAK